MKIKFNLDKSQIMSVKDPAIIYVSFEGGELSLTDNEGNASKPGELDDFVTDVAPSGEIAWKSAEGSDVEFNVKVESGASIFKELPSEEKGTWQALIDEKESGTAVYSIYRSGDAIRTEALGGPKLDIKPPI